MRRGARRAGRVAHAARLTCGRVLIVRFSCDECGRSYVAGDEVAGRAFRMRCRQCGNEILVRPPGAAQPASPFSRGDASAASADGTPAPTGSPGPFTVPASTSSVSAPGSTSRARADGEADTTTDAAPADAGVAAGGAGRGLGRGAGRARPAFDPFDAVPDGELAVETEALEIFERTPPARNLAAPPPRGTRAAGTAAAGSRPAIPAAPPAAARSGSRTPAPPRGRAGRMLPAEDEAMLGPPGAEDRRAIPRWVIALVLVALAAAGGMVFLR